MRQDELRERLDHLINGQTLWSGCLTMTFVQTIYTDPELTVFDRDGLMTRLVNLWNEAHATVIIPPNPNNLPYLVISLDHPDYHTFTDTVDEAILLRSANIRSGYATRIVETQSGEIISK